MYEIPKQKARLRENTKRFTPEKYTTYQTHIKDIGLCQVCEESIELDTPHHTKQGLGVKDDRSLICICLTCHNAIHTQGFSKLNKTRIELEEIGKENWSNYND